MQKLENASWSEIRHMGSDSLSGLLLRALWMSKKSKKPISINEISHRRWQNIQQPVRKNTGIYYEAALEREAAK